MRNVSVAIADGDRDYLKRNTERLSRMEGIDIVASTIDGSELIRTISDGNVDVVVTGLTLSGVDGLAVLEAMQAMNRTMPKTIVVTNMTSNSIVNAAVGLGASYYLIKPVDMTLVYNRIRILTKEQAEECEGDADFDPRLRIGRLLRKMGISPSMKGYGFLEEAVVIRNGREEKCRHLTGYLYPEIAKRFDVSPLCVERAIRTAIAGAWNKGLIQRFAAQTNDALLLRGKPTAGQMIEKLSVLVRDKGSRLN